GLVDKLLQLRRDRRHGRQRRRPGGQLERGRWRLTGRNAAVRRLLVGRFSERRREQHRSHTDYPRRRRSHSAAGRDGTQAGQDDQARQARRNPRRSTRFVLDIWRSRERRITSIRGVSDEHAFVYDPPCDGRSAAEHRRRAPWDSPDRPHHGGDFDGPWLRGSVLPGGSGDWLLLRADGVLELDFRATLRTDDG